MRNTDAAASGNLWANKVCVAAALAAPQHLGPKIIAGAASCNNPEGITSLAGIPSLDYNVSALLPMSSPPIGVPDRKLLTGSGRCTQASLASARGRRAAARSRARTSSTSSTVRSRRLRRAHTPSKRFFTAIWMMKRHTYHIVARLKHLSTTTFSRSSTGLLSTSLKASLTPTSTTVSHPFAPAHITY